MDLMAWLDLAGLTPPSFIAGVEGEGLAVRLGCAGGEKLQLACVIGAFSKSFPGCVAPVAQEGSPSEVSGSVTPLREGSASS